MRNARAAKAEASLKIAELIATYSDPHASAAALLCDRYDPEAVAYRIVSPDLASRDLTYGDLRHESERLAASLAELGIRQGDRVATLMGKSREYLVTLVAIWRIGAVHVPLFTAFAPSAIALRMSGSKAKAVVCDASQRDKLLPGTDMPDPLPWHIITTGSSTCGAIGFATLMARSAARIETATAVGGSAPLIHIYTSGTTGAPKGVVVPLRALASVRAYAHFGLDLRADDFYWCAADPGWAYGLYFGILGAITTGTPSLLLEGGFSAQTTLDVLQRFHVTNFAAAPTVFRAIRADDRIKPDGLSLRCVSSAGEPLTSDVNDWATSFLGAPVHDHYGQTEAGMLINNHHHSSLQEPLVPGSMGRALPGWDAAVLKMDTDQCAAVDEVGRIAMNLANSPLAWFSGYVGDAAKSAEKFTPDGLWYLTGDTGWVDANGRFYFSSRDDDVIIMAGYRIGPSELEAVIATHESVKECAVIAVPETVRGEVIEAYVVLKNPASLHEGLEAELQRWVKTRYAAHAYPRSVHFVDALPRTPSGKLQRSVLRQRRRSEIACEVAASA